MSAAFDGLECVEVAIGDVEAAVGHQLWLPDDHVRAGDGARHSGPAQRLEIGHRPDFDASLLGPESHRFPDRVAG